MIFSIIIIVYLYTYKINITQFKDVCIYIMYTLAKYSAYFLRATYLFLNLIINL